MTTSGPLRRVVALLAFFDSLALFCACISRAPLAPRFSVGPPAPALAAVTLLCPQAASSGVAPKPRSPPLSENPLRAPSIPISSVAHTSQTNNECWNFHFLVRARESIEFHFDVAHACGSGGQSEERQTRSTKLRCMVCRMRKDRRIRRRRAAVGAGREASAAGLSHTGIARILPIDPRISGFVCRDSVDPLSTRRSLRS